MLILIKSERSEVFLCCRFVVWIAAVNVTGRKNAVAVEK